MTPLPALTALFALAVAIRVAEGHDSSALAFELPDGERQCFYQKYTDAKKLTLQFEVIKGGRYDIDVTVETPNGKIIYSEKKTRKDIFDFESSLGVYSFCFGNEFSTYTHKVVYFEIRPQGHDTLLGETGMKKPYANTQLEESMDKINEFANEVKTIQTSYRLIEGLGRHEANMLSKRVQMWSIGEAIVIVLMGFGQVIILRRFFSYSPGSPGRSTAVEKTLVTP